MDDAQRLSRISEELLRIRDELDDGDPIRLRVWEFESVADRRSEGDDDATPTFGVDEPDEETRQEGLVHIAAKLHLDGVHGWSYLAIDLDEPEATLDRESYLNPDHCVRSHVPYALDDGFRLRGKETGDAAGFAEHVVQVLREELEELGELQARDAAG